MRTSVHFNPLDGVMGHYELGDKRPFTIEEVWGANSINRGTSSMSSLRMPLEPQFLTSRRLWVSSTAPSRKLPIIIASLGPRAPYRL